MAVFSGSLLTGVPRRVLFLYAVEFFCAGTQNGKMLRIRDEGVPSGGHRGNMYIKLLVRVPEKLSRRGKELMEELARTEGQNDSPGPIPLSQLSEG